MKKSTRQRAIKLVGEAALAALFTQAGVENRPILVGRQKFTRWVDDGYETVAVKEVRTIWAMPDGRICSAKTNRAQKLEAEAQEEALTEEYSG